MVTEKQAVEAAVIDEAVARATAAVKAGSNAEEAAAIASEGQLTGDPDNHVTVTGNDEMVTIYALAPGMLYGESRLVLLNDLRRDMAKTLPTGGRAFWHESLGGEVPKQRLGEILCWLHPESPDREWLDTVGLVGLECNDGNKQAKNHSTFISVMEMEKHVERKHPMTWATVERARVEQRRLEDRATADRQFEAMMAMANRGAPQVEAPPAPVVNPLPPNISPASFTQPGTMSASGVEVWNCTQCEHDPFDTEQGLKIHVGREHKAE